MPPIIIGIGIGPSFGDGAEIAAFNGIDDPTDLDNLILWLDGNDATTFTFHSGVLVSQWDDKSGVDNHVTQGTSGNAPDYDSVNGRVTFNGLSEWLKSAAFAGGDESVTTIALVVEQITQASQGGTDSILDGITSGERQLIFSAREDTSGDFGIYNGTATIDTGQTINNGSKRIIVITFDTATDTVYIEGGAAVISGDGGTHVLGGVALGANWNNIAWFTGHIHEAIIYSDVKSEDDINLLGNYLANKWDLGWFDSGTGYQPDIPGQKGRNHAGSGVTKISGKVSNWADSSGNNNDLFQLTASKRPIFTASDADFNNLPVITFDGVDDLLVTNTFSGGKMIQPNTVFLVARWDATTNGTSMMDGIAAGNRASYKTTNGNHSLLVTALVEYENADTNAHIFTIEWNGASSKFFEDGGTSLSNNPGNHSLTGITLGAQYDGSGPGEVTIAEVIIYDGLLSTTDQNTIGNELATRYGLSYTDR